MTSLVCGAVVEHCDASDEGYVSDSSQQDPLATAMILPFAAIPLPFCHAASAADPSLVPSFFTGRNKGCTLSFTTDPAMEQECEIGEECNLTPIPRNRTPEFKLLRSVFRVALDCHCHALRRAKELAEENGFSTSYGWPVWWRKDDTALAYMGRDDSFVQVDFDDPVDPEAPALPCPVYMTSYTRQSAMTAFSSSWDSFCHFGPCIPTLEERDVNRVAHKIESVPRSRSVTIDSVEHDAKIEPSRRRCVAAARMVGTERYASARPKLRAVIPMAAVARGGQSLDSRHQLRVRSNSI